MFLKIQEISENLNYSESVRQNIVAIYDVVDMSL